MRLRGTDFGLVWDASGVRNFFDEGYWYHKYLRPFGLDFDSSTFVAKTTTLCANKGNLPLREDFQPNELLPRCVAIKPLAGVALNAVGLSGPGAKELFETGQWQKRQDRFFISFAPITKTPKERILETEEFVKIFRKHLDEFNAPVGLQINVSCPNIDSRTYGNLVWEVNQILDIAGWLGVLIILKFSIITPPEVAYQIGLNLNCDGICVSNSIPFGQLPELIDWKKLFGDKPPLAHLGGGGLSGKPLLPLVEKWVKDIRRLGYKKYINAGGGILCERDADKLFLAGADSIFLGSIAFLRPWRVGKIIRTFNNL